MRFLRTALAARHRRRKLALAVGFCALFALLHSWPVSALGASGSIDRLRETTWTTGDGLPQNGILSLAQSEDGFLWIGTQEGLARFDGVEFRVFDRGAHPAFEDQFITALAPADEGGVWVGTREGLIRLSRAGVERIDLEKGLPSPYIRSLSPGPAGVLWVGTYGGGLARLSEDGIRVYGERDGLRDLFVRALAMTRDGTVWAGTSRGLARIDQRGLEMVDDPAGPGPRSIRCLVVDGRDRLWVGSDGGGLFRATGGSFEHVAVEGVSTVKALAVDSDGSLWLAAEPDLLARVDATDRVEARRAVASNSLLGDAEGSLWLGTNDGLIQLKEPRVRTVETGDGDALAVRTVVETRAGRIWIGSDAGGVRELLNGSLATPPALAGLATASVRSLWEDHNGVLWIGTRDGLLRYDGSGLRQFNTGDGLPSPTVNALTLSPDGRLWVGTPSGVAVWDGESFTPPSHAASRLLAGARVRSLQVDRDGTLWVGTESGLVANRAETSLLNRGDGLAGDFILSLHEDGKGNLWVGTSAGLSVLLGDEIVRFSTAQGVPQRAIFSILEDGSENLWLCSSRGIHRLALAELLAVAEGRLAVAHALSLTEEDGLASSQCNGGTQPAGWRTGDGRLLFPTRKGLAVVEPDLLEARSLPPRTVIDSVRVENTPVAALEGLELGPESRSLEIGFTAPTFQSPHGVVFRYRLDGIHEDWIHAGNRRRVFFADLRPGAYKFRVEAGSEDGLWDETARVLEFSVRPSLLERTEVRLAAALLLATIVGGLYGLRMRQARRREQLLEAQVDERTLQLQRANEVLAGLAATDALTGITNYRHFQELLRDEWRRGVRRERELSLIMLDIDHFKDFNDTYGHAAGDACLKRVAEALDRVVNRPGDVIARYGGEEFAALLPETSEESARLMAERFRRCVEELGIPNPNSTGSSVVTLSAGVATIVPKVEIEPKFLFDLADSALYKAKRAGRNQVSRPPG